MNENICLANFGDKLKVNGKVDLQYVMEDGSIIHNEAKNTAFPSTWSTSALIKCLLSKIDNQTVYLELTDGDNDPDLKFPFLTGEPVGFAYVNSSASGLYLGAEIANKRIINFSGGKLILSFTYEWTASQIPGTIRSIGYTLQNLPSNYSNSAYVYSPLTAPIISATDQIFPRMVFSTPSYTVVYDYKRKVTYAMSSGTPSGNPDGSGWTVRTQCYKYSNDMSFSNISSAIGFKLTDFKPYDYYMYDSHLYYNADDGSFGIILDWRVKETSKSDWVAYRSLYLIDMDTKTSTLQWTYEIDRGTNITSAYINPFRSTLGDEYKVLVQKDGNIYMKLNGSYSSVTSLINNNPAFTSTFCYMPIDALRGKTSSDMLSFCKPFSKIFNDSGSVYDCSFCIGGYNYFRGFTVNLSGDIGYLCDSENIIYNTTSTQSAISVLIDSSTKQLVISRKLSNPDNNSNGNSGDGPIERLFLGNECIYYIPRYDGVNTSRNESIYPRSCADAQMFQALTQFHVPAEAQVRPENSGVRVVYELTISNPT